MLLLFKKSKFSFLVVWYRTRQICYPIVLASETVIFDLENLASEGGSSDIIFSQTKPLIPLAPSDYPAG